MPKPKKPKKLDPRKIQTDPVYFVENVVYADTPYTLTDFQKEWLRLIEDKKRVCLMAFRTSGKTRQLFVHYFIWKAITNPASQYLIISKTLPQAIEVLKDIRITLLTNKFLKTLVPSNKSQTWSRTELEFKNHSRILSKAYNENVRGLHVAGVGCDELGEYENHEVFRKAVLPTIRAKRGFLVCVGTPKSELDLLHEIERDPGFESIYFDNMSWYGPGHVAPSMRDPRQVYDRLFSTSANTRYRNITDLVLGNARNLRKKLGTTDRQKFAEYFEAIRSIENRMDKMDAIKSEVSKYKTEQPDEHSQAVSQSRPVDRR